MDKQLEQYRVISVGHSQQHKQVSIRTIVRDFKGSCGKCGLSLNEHVAINEPLTKKGI